jgi:hypothetical protein
MNQRSDQKLSRSVGNHSSQPRRWLRGASRSTCMNRFDHKDIPRKRDAKCESIFTSCRNHFKGTRCWQLEGRKMRCLLSQRYNKHNREISYPLNTPCIVSKFFLLSLFLPLDLFTHTHTHRHTHTAFATPCTSQHTLFSRNFRFFESRSFFVLVRGQVELFEAVSIWCVELSIFQALRIRSRGCSFSVAPFCLFLRIWTKVRTKQIFFWNCKGVDQHKILTKYSNPRGDETLEMQIFWSTLHLGLDRIVKRLSKSPFVKERVQTQDKLSQTPVELS